MSGRGEVSNHTRRRQKPHRHKPRHGFPRSGVVHHGEADRPAAVAAGEACQNEVVNLLDRAPVGKSAADTKKRRTGIRHEITRAVHPLHRVWMRYTTYHLKEPCEVTRGESEVYASSRSSKTETRLNEVSLGSRGMTSV